MDARCIYIGRGVYNTRGRSDSSLHLCLRIVQLCIRVPQLLKLLLLMVQLLLLMVQLLLAKLLLLLKELLALVSSCRRQFLGKRGRQMGEG